MHVTETFEEKDQARILSFVKENSFAIVVSPADATATHTPLLLERQGDQLILTGHIAAQNPQAATLTDGATALCIFHGPHAYVSARWYKQPEIPDWNYRAVHATGMVKVLKGEEAKQRLVAMMNFLESRFENPAGVDELPVDKVNDYLQNSHVFEVQVQKLEAIARLSQNHGADGMRHISNNLKQQDDVSAMLIGFEMEQRARKQ
jgi:transcriptional regulator